MHIFIISILTSLLHLAQSLPASTTHVLHERRNEAATWRPRQDLRPYRSTRIKARIGLAQSNLESGHDLLMRISDPSSKEYGQHLSQDELVKFFAPAEHAIDRVTTWLKSSGIENVELDRGRHWLNFMATVAQLEDLLHTEYKFYAAPSGKQAIACDEYSVPGDLQRYIDLVQPTIHLTAAGVVDKKKQPIPKRDSSTGLPSLGSPDDPSLPKKGPNKPPSNSTGVSHEVVFWACADQMTPGCLRALYGIPPTGHLPPRPAPDVPLTTFGVVEFDPQSYLPDDFDPFYKQFEPDVPAGTRPVLLSVDGGALQTNQQGSDFNTESNLDLQYAISLGKSIST